MKIVKYTISLVVVIFIVLETGVLSRLFDRRCVVEDSVSGGSHWIISVDGDPVDRVKHGFVVTTVPYALVPEGKHVMEFSRQNTTHGSEIVGPFDVYLKRGKRYRVVEKEGRVELEEVVK